MAVDETLLASLGSGGRPTLRLYGWASPSLSLGYRALRTVGALEPDWLSRADARGVELVRRATGGGAVLHSGDLSYSVAAARDTAPIPNGMSGSYAWIQLALLDALREAGIRARPGRGDREASAEPLCFRASTGSEIEASGAKLVGSAQRRSVWGFLQHGSIRLRDDSELYDAIFGSGPGPAPSGTRHTDPAVLSRAIIASFERRLGCKFERRDLSRSELEEARSREQLRVRDRLWLPSLLSSRTPPSPDNAR